MLHSAFSISRKAAAELPQLASFKGVTYLLLGFFGKVPVAKDV